LDHVALHTLSVAATALVAELQSGVSPALAVTSMLGRKLGLAPLPSHNTHTLNDVEGDQLVAAHGDAATHADCKKHAVKNIT
jgi:hypothetical protein